METSSKSEKSGLRVSWRWSLLALVVVVAVVAVVLVTKLFAGTSPYSVSGVISVAKESGSVSCNRWQAVRVEILDSAGQEVGSVQPTVEAAQAGCALRFIVPVSPETQYRVFLSAPADLEDAIGIRGFEGPQVSFDALATSSFNLNLALATSFRPISQSAGDQVPLDQLAQESLAQAMINAMSLQAQGGASTAVYVEMLSSADPTTSYVDASHGATVSVGEIGLRDATSNRLLLVTRTIQGDYLCIAESSSGIEKGRQDALLAADCRSGW